MPIYSIVLHMSHCYFSISSKSKSEIENNYPTPTFKNRAFLSYKKNTAFLNSPVTIIQSLLQDFQEELQCARASSYVKEDQFIECRANYIIF